MPFLFCTFDEKEAQSRSPVRQSKFVKEDEGAKQAVDADTAVLQAKTGHQVEKKKEWYI